MATHNVDNTVLADQHTMDEKHGEHNPANQNNGGLATDGLQENGAPIDHSLEPHNPAIHGHQHKFAGLHGRKLGMAISIVATTGFLLFGYDQGVMSGIISAEPFNAYFPETKDDSVYQGFVTAIYEIGCLVGAIGALAFGDSLGRRKMVSFPQNTHQ